MALPSQADPEAPADIPLLFALEGGELLPASDSGIKIVVFLENADGTMVANGRIEVTDTSKPVMIPFMEGAVKLTALIMNCCLENKNAKVTIAAGPYIASVSPNPAVRGGTVTVKGLSFGTIQDTGTLYLDGRELSSVTSWNNSQIVFTIPADALSGALKVVPAGGAASNEVRLEVEEPPQGSFEFLQSWSKKHYPSGSIVPDTIDFTASVSGRVINAINPLITLKDFNVDNAKIVEASNMKRSEVVTVEGTIAVTLSTLLISPTSPTFKSVYSYSNPKLLWYEDGVLIGTYQDMHFSWTVDSDETYENDLDLYVAYDVEQKDYRRETEDSAFTLYSTNNYVSKVFHLRIDVIKDVPDWGTP
jgi:hypothetical protein